MLLILNIFNVEFNNELDIMSKVYSYIFDRQLLILYDDVNGYIN
jgi:hypothetical protein